MSLQKLLTLAGLLAVVAAGARPARAQVESAAFRGARQSFEAGARAEQQDNWREACARYRESLERLERPANAWKVGVCHRRERRFVLAWKALQRAKELNRADVSYKPDFEQVLDLELGMIPTLRIDLATANEGLEVLLDDSVVAPDLIGREQPVELGPHRITATAPGYEPAQLRVEVERPWPYVVTIPMQRSLPLSALLTPSAAIAPPAAPLAPLALPPPAAPGSPRKAWGWGLGGAGAAGLVASGVLGIVTLRLVSESSPHCAYPDGSCDPEGVRLRERASGFQTAGFVLAGASLLALGGGLYLLATAEPRPPGRTNKTSLALMDGQLMGRTSW